MEDNVIPFPGGQYVQQAMEAIHKDLAHLSAFGYLGGGFPAEKSVVTIPIPLTGRVREALQVLSNLESLPYQSSITKIMQHAVYVFATELAGVMADNGMDQCEEIVAALKWERQLAVERQRSDRINAFKSLLAAKVEELTEEMRMGSANNVQAVLAEMRSLALSAPGLDLPVRLSHIVLGHPTVEKAVNFCSQSKNPAVREWIENQFQAWVDTLPPVVKGDNHGS